MQNTVTLSPLTKDDREQFILDNQWAFKHGALIEFGERDNHIDGDGEIISRETIESSIDNPKSVTYRIMLDDRRVGGVIIKVDEKTQHNHLDILFVNPTEHSKGIGFEAWRAIEALHPKTRIWETCTPYFEKRNIHFYVNKCGFHIVEFYNEYNIDPHSPDDDIKGEGPDEMFRFIKVMGDKGVWE